MNFSEGTYQQRVEMVSYRKYTSKKHTQQHPYCVDFVTQTAQLELLLRQHWNCYESKRMMAIIISASWDYLDPLAYVHHWVHKVLEYIGYGVRFELLYEPFQDQQKSLFPIDNIPSDQKSAHELWAFDQAVKQGLVIPFEQMAKDLSYGHMIDHIHLN